MIETILLIIVAILIWKYWEKVKLATAGILFVIAFAIWGIGFCAYCAASAVFNHIRR